MNIFNLFKKKIPEQPEEKFYKIGWEIRVKDGYVITSIFPNVCSSEKEDVMKKVKDQIVEMQNEFEKSLIEKKDLVNLCSNILFTDQVKSITFFLEDDKK